MRLLSISGVFGRQGRPRSRSSKKTFNCNQNLITHFRLIFIKRRRSTNDFALLAPNYVHFSKLRQNHFEANQDVSDDSRSAPTVHSFLANDQMSAKTDHKSVNDLKYNDQNNCDFHSEIFSSIENNNNQCIDSHILTNSVSIKILYSTI